MSDLPGPGLKPVPPELAGGFLTTAPRGKPVRVFLIETFGLPLSASEHVEQITVQSSVLFDFV